MYFFLKGIIIGLIIAIPIGPVGVLCIQRTITKSRLSGILTGLGAAVADSLFGLIAGFGLVAISDLLINMKATLAFAGSIALIYIGISSLSKKKINQKASTAHTPIRDFSSAFLITLTSPATILGFIAIFAGMGLAAENTNYIRATLLVLGVFIGSMMWWVTISTLSYRARRKFSGDMLAKINKTAGIIIAILGVLILLNI